MLCSRLQHPHLSTQITEWNTWEAGCVFCCAQECFYPVFCISGDSYPAVLLYCSVGARARICWYLCHAVSLSVARLLPRSALPLFSSPKATFDLARRRIFSLVIRTLDTRHTVSDSLVWMTVSLFARVWLGDSLTFSTLGNSYCVSSRCCSTQIPCGVSGVMSFFYTSCP